MLNASAFDDTWEQKTALLKWNETLEDPKEKERRLFYERYDAGVGIRTAVTLAGLLLMFIVILLYKGWVKNCMKSENFGRMNDCSPFISKRCSEKRVNRILTDWAMESVPSQMNKQVADFQRQECDKETCIQDTINRSNYKSRHSLCSC